MSGDQFEIAAVLAAVAALRQRQRELSGYERWRATRIAALDASINGRTRRR